MLESTIEGDGIVRHTFSGGLTSRDVVEARRFVEDVQTSLLLKGVLWDIRQATAALPINRYETLARIIINHGSEPPIKRAFLVVDSTQAEKLKIVFAEVATQWPWQIFKDETSALTWLV